MNDEIAAASRRAGEAEQCAAEAEGRAATAQQHAAEALERAAAADLKQAAADAALAESTAVAATRQAEVDELRRQLAAAQVDAAASTELPRTAPPASNSSPTPNSAAQNGSLPSGNRLACRRLEAAQQELAELKTSAQSPPDLAERDELQRKFDLALADVQKLKRELSEAREELPHRPEASDQESPELIAIRSERDALCSRIAELEATPPAAADADAQQDRDDLHRRFEMAVDDVRQLKQENAQLRDKLAASKTPPGAATPGGNIGRRDARLMAELEEEDGASPRPPIAVKNGRPSRTPSR